MGADVPLLEMGGFQLGDPYVKISSESENKGDKENSGCFSQYRLYLRIGNNRKYNFSRNRENQKFNPSIIRGYASYMYALSRLMEKKSIEYSGCNSCNHRGYVVSSLPENY